MNPLARRFSPAATHGTGVAAVAIALLAQSLAAATPMTVQSSAGLSADICDTCPIHATLPLTLAEVDVAALEVRVVDVAFAARHDQELLQAVTATIDKKPVDPRLNITVREGALRSPGTYSVLLTFSAPEKNPVTLTLQLTRTAATLQPLGTLIVERTLGVPSFLAGEVPAFFARPDARPRLRLYETSRRTGLTSVRMEPPAGGATTAIITVAAPVPCPGSAASASPGTAVPPNGERCLPYTLQGFPLGALSQTHTISAPELAAPVPIVFDVRTKLAAGYILVYMFAGLLLSFFLKIVLQRRIELGEARVPALDLLRKVEADRQAHPDTAFLGDTNKEVEALTVAVNGRDVAKIGSARTALETAWRAALDRLTRRRQAAQTLIDQFRSVTETAWEIPDEIAGIVGRLRPGVDRLRDLLTQEHVSDVETDAKSLRAEAVSKIAPAIRRWQDAIPQVLGRLADAPTGLSEDVQDALNPALSEAKNATSSARLNPASTSLDEVVQALNAISTDRRNARKPMLVLIAAVDHEIDRIAAAIRVNRRELPEPVDAVTTARTLLLAAVNDPEGKRDDVFAALKAIQDAWQAVALRVAGGTLTDQVVQLLEERKFLEAIVRAKPPKPRAAGTVEEDAAVVRVGALFASGDDAAAPVLRFDTTVSPAERIPALIASQELTSGQITRAKLWQTLVVGLMAAVIGYGLFAPKFIGDYQDFVLIFFWAFGLDLTVDAVARLAPTARRT